MATKKIELAGIGPVTLVKSSRNRSLRLTITSTGVRVSMPQWTPFSAGSAFAQSHATWIKSELAKHNTDAMESGQRIGKLHYLRFEQILDGRSPTGRVTGTEVVVGVGHGEHSSDSAVQKRAHAAAVRALKREGEQLLPARLRGLSERFGLPFNSVTVKSLKRRWGSCDSSQNIACNLYLMELPWDYIDYVLCHELTHTIHMNHGPEFWKKLVSINPRARDLSHQLRKHQPVIGNWLPADA